VSFDDRRRNVRSLIFFLVALLATVVASFAGSPCRRRPAPRAVPASP
jgi:hypothetical protein